MKKCFNCEEELKKKETKFCSNKCQQDFYLKERIPLIKQGLIKDPRVIKRYILQRDGCICSICKSTEWMGKIIPLIMDHIDGNSDNNKETNLRLVCGNCDMQLPTYKSKNIGKGRFLRTKRKEEGKSY